MKNHFLAYAFVYILVYVVLMLPLTAAGVDRFVDDTARDAGDNCATDNGAGTQADPWGSLYFAMNQLSCGDTL